jgi:hypothetical protein
MDHVLQTSEGLIPFQVPFLNAFIKDSSITGRHINDGLQFVYPISVLIIPSAHSVDRKRDTQAKSNKRQKKNQLYSNTEMSKKTVIAHGVGEIGWLTAWVVIQPLYENAPDIST